MFLFDVCRLERTELFYLTLQECHNLLQQLVVLSNRRSVYFNTILNCVVVTESTQSDDWVLFDGIHKGIVDQSEDCTQRILRVTLKFMDVIVFQDEA